MFLPETTTRAISTVFHITSTSSLPPRLIILKLIYNPIRAHTNHSVLDLTIPNWNFSNQLKINLLAPSRPENIHASLLQSNIWLGSRPNNAYDLKLSPTHNLLHESEPSRLGLHKLINIKSTIKINSILCLPLCLPHMKAIKFSNPSFACSSLVYLISPN